MKVNLTGIHFKFSRNIEMGEFVQQLEAIEEKEIEIQGRRHLLMADIVDGYLCGLILTYRKSKKSLATQRDKNGDLIVNKSALKPGERGTEVCLFCINPGTRKGLVYNYRGAISPTGLKELFRKQDQWGQSH